MYRNSVMEMMQVAIGPTFNVRCMASSPAIDQERIEHPQSTAWIPRNQAKCSIRAWAGCIYKKNTHIKGSQTGQIRAGLVQPT